MENVKTGITRKVDTQGRIHIPRSVRTMLKWSERDNLELIVDKDVLILKKIEQRCIICNSPDNLVEYRGKTFCQTCFNELQGKN